MLYKTLSMVTEILQSACRGDRAAFDLADLLLKVHIRLLLALMQEAKGVISLSVTGNTLHKGGIGREG